MNYDAWNKKILKKKYLNNFHYVLMSEIYKYKYEIKNKIFYKFSLFSHTFHQFF